MPEIAAKNALDFSGAQLVNTRVRYDGQIELASRNLLSNPDLQDLDNQNAPQGVTLDSVEAPSGWGIYMRRLGDPTSHLTLQTPGPLATTRDSWVLQGDLIDGPEPKDQKTPAKVAPPPPPYVEVVDYANSGFAAGYYGISYGWIVGDDWHDSFLLTDPSPRAVVNLASGQYVKISFSGESAPKGAVGVYFAMTAPQTNQNAAASTNTTIYIQERHGLSGGLLPQYTLEGPFRRGHIVSQNTTYVGGGDQWPAPRWHYGRLQIRIHGFVTRLSYRFRTRWGWSKPQQATGVIDTHSRANTRCGLYWRPHRLPQTALAWQPMFFSDPADPNTPGQWYLWPEELPLSVSAILYRADPENWPKNYKPIPYDRAQAYSKPDQTGLSGPDAPIDSAAITIAGRITPPAGRYRVRSVYYDSDGNLTAPSAPATDDAGTPYFTIAQGQTLKVYRPSFGNLIPNANSQVKLADGTLDGWELVATSGLTITDQKNRIDVSDTSASTLDQTVATTPTSRLPDAVINGGRLAIRAVANTTRYSSGAIRLQVIFLSGDGTQSQTITVGDWKPTGANQRYEWLAYAGFATTSPNADVTIPAYARKAKLRFVFVGSNTSYGARDLDATLRSFAFFEGMSVPRRKSASAVWPLPDLDDDDSSEYPPGGTVDLVQYTDAGSFHPDLAGIQLSVVDYWAPYGTPPGDPYPITGYATPVVGGMTYTLSCYCSYRGVSQPTSLITTAFFDAGGSKIKTNAPLIPNVTGTSACARYELTVTAPQNAAYLAITGGGASDGRYKLGAFQLDAGASATAYTNQNATSGSVTVTLDTATPGVLGDSSPTRTLLAMTGVAHAGVLDTEDSATSTTVSFRSSDSLSAPNWSSWTSDYTKVPPRRYWQIQANLSTTDATQSPLVSWMGLDIRRREAVLLRADGSEYPDGAIIQNFPTTQTQRIADTFVAEDGTNAYRVRGVEVEVASGFTILCFTDEAAQQIASDVYNPDADGATHIIESDALGVRMKVRLSPLAFSVTRANHDYTNEPSPYVLQADVDAGAQVIAKETL